jgi:glycosyltransferase involved in cell wall biosynthesis
MPTRTDAQGLMMCEMAAFGIPVITSDIPVCHEVFDGFSNAYFISNDDKKENLNKYLEKPTRCLKDTRFFEERTAGMEVDLIISLCKE